MSIDFDHFVADRQRALLRFAAVLTGDPHLAEDLVAAVLGRAWQRWGRISVMEQPNAYVRRMIVNEFTSWHRRLRRAKPLTEQDDYPAQSSDHAFEHAERAELNAHLSTLPRKQQAMLALRFHEGLSTGEIAAVLGCGESTVRSNITRALTTLRIRIDATPAEASASTAMGRAPSRTSRTPVASRTPDHLRMKGDT